MAGEIAMNTDNPTEKTVIWKGILEWTMDKQRKGTPDWDKVTRRLSVILYSPVVDGRPEVNGDNWSTKLVLQFVSLNVIRHLGSKYLLDDVNIVSFMSQDSDSLNALSKKLDSGYAGYVYFTESGTQPNTCKFKMLLLLYIKAKSTYLGVIPKDQNGFMSRLRKLDLGHRRRLQQRRQMQQLPVPSNVQQTTMTPKQTPRRSVRLKQKRREYQQRLKAESRRPGSYEQQHPDPTGIMPNQQPQMMAGTNLEPAGSTMMMAGTNPEPACSTMMPNQRPQMMAGTNPQQACSTRIPNQRPQMIPGSYPHPVCPAMMPNQRPQMMLRIYPHPERFRDLYHEIMLGQQPQTRRKRPRKYQREIIPDQPLRIPTAVVIEQPEMNPGQAPYQKHNMVQRELVSQSGMSKVEKISIKYLIKLLRQKDQPAEMGQLPTDPIPHRLQTLFPLSIKPMDAFKIPKRPKRRRPA